MKAVAERWKALPAAEREGYEREASALKEQWQKDQAAWCVRRRRRCPSLSPTLCESQSVTVVALRPSVLHLTRRPPRLSVMSARELLHPDGPPPEPRRASLPQDADPASLTIERAAALLALPKSLGTHPREPGARPGAPRRPDSLLPCLRKSYQTGFSPPPLRSPQGRSCSARVPSGCTPSTATSSLPSPKRRVSAPRPSPLPRASLRWRSAAVAPHAAN